MGNKTSAIIINKDDNVAIACRTLKKDDRIRLRGKKIILKNNIDLAHKLAIKKIRKYDKIIKFGVSIGSATRDINIGEHIHLHNIKSDYIATRGLHG